MQIIRKQISINLNGKQLFMFAAKKKTVSNQSAFMRDRINRSLIFVTQLLLICFASSQVTVKKSDQLKHLDDGYFSVLSQLLTKMDSKRFDPSQVQSFFTDDGYSQFTALYQATRFIPNRVEYTIDATNAFKETDKFFKDEVLIGTIDLKSTTVKKELIVNSYNFVFDKNSVKIKEMRMIDPKLDFKLFMEDNEDIKSERIIADIKRFIERFRTYYEEKNISEIEKIYSEDAIIITGKRVNKVAEDQNVVMATDGSKYELTRLKKQDYISRLKTVFKKLTDAKSYLKLSFENIEIRQHGKYPKVYGVNLQQKWNTRNYTDTGDLFLIIDYTFPETPQIRIRTWMPEGTGYKLALYDFKLN
ncbi:MAG: hypothetical protein KDD94_00920 [Calditrichaeota bacterium]|nr:hypothetical protein [Calditrichota bacterium]